MKANRNAERGTRSLETRRGMALIIVLGLLVIILGLVITFLNRTTIERGASASYAASASTRQFADTAVNLVEGQIHRATTLGRNAAWASQPGMIRTFATGTSPNYTASTSPLLNFKLYSAPDMVTSGTTFAGDAPPADWAAEKALWTDLNAPVRGIYPILAPQPNSGGAEEFSITNAPGATTAQPMPMPVRWLYVRQNGELVTPGGSGNAVTVAISGTNNPIVGRIAFWTDDETCKVNINTASEGTFWDTPRADTTEERAFANYQPAQKEFQRYSGHPAMTSLKAVFPALTADEIYNIVPRVVGGGSAGGTAVPSSALTPDSDRLYATVDELVFAAGGSPRTTSPLTQSQLEAARFFLTASSRAPEVTLFNTPRVAIWPIDVNTTSAFRTPSDTLFAFCATINAKPYYLQRQNPKSATNDYVNIGRNQDLYGYLQDLTDASFPGFGGNAFATKFGDDRDQLLTETFDYIRSTNLDDSGLAEANRYGKRAELAPVIATPRKLGRGFSQVVPLRIGTTQGFGRFPAITEAGIQFICTADAGPAPAVPGGVLGSNVVGSGTVPNNKTLGGTLLIANHRRVEALFFLETFVAGEGFPHVWPAYSVRIRGLDLFQINGTSLGFPSDATDLSDAMGQNILHGRSRGGTSSHRTSLSGSRLPARGGVMPADAGSTDLNRYPFVSVPITVDTTAGTMTFVGGTLTIDVYPRSKDTLPGYDSATTNPVNTYTLDFPGGTFPIPSLVTAGTPAAGSGSPYGAGSPESTGTSKEFWWTFSRDGCGLGPATEVPASGIPRLNGRLRFIHATPCGTDVTQPREGAPFRTEDVVRTVVPGHSDFRLLAASETIPSGAFTKHPSYDAGVPLAHATTEASNSNFFAGTTFATNLLGAGLGYSITRRPDVAIHDSASDDNGDWDNGISITVDGPYTNMPDEGNSRGLSVGTIPYFTEDWEYTSSGQAMFSPNRQVPSAGMFGSLSSGVKTGAPYRTLLFRPQTGHFGDTDPKDHLWTDLFWMPVVEPYAISEPFSTAGKVNMNYQIVPFNYIRRATGLAAILRSEKIMAVPNGNAGNYKANVGTASFRKPIDIPVTLSQFDARFAAGDVFRSASQICELHLVPTGQTVAGMSTFWDNNKLTGDNSRERSYTNILGRLTTKSNTYTVHYRVQSLKKSPATDAGQWDESRDKITGEYRGSTTIERYINPNETTIPDYGSAADPLGEQGLGNFYKWRVINTRQFSP